METALGIYAFACMEAARPYFLEVVQAGGRASAKFLAAVWPSGCLRFKSKCRKFELVLGIRRDVDPNWNMPQRTRGQLLKNINWRMATFA